MLLRKCIEILTDEGVRTSTLFYLITTTLENFSVACYLGDTRPKPTSAKSVSGRPLSERPLVCPSVSPVLLFVINRHY